MSSVNKYKKKTGKKTIYVVHLTTAVSWLDKYYDVNEIFIWENSYNRE